jgi:hypothetical protein
MPLGVARQPHVLKDRPRGRSAEGRIMPEAQVLAQVLHRGTRLQPIEVLKRLSRPRLQVCDFFWTTLHQPPTCVLQRAARVSVRRTRLQGRHEYSTAYHAPMTWWPWGYSPANVVGNYGMRH